MTDVTKRTYRWKYEQNPTGRTDLHIRQMRKRLRDAEKWMLSAGASPSEDPSDRN